MILTAENYYSPEMQLAYMGYSQFKDFSECEFMAMQKIKGFYVEPEKDAFLLGKYLDAHFEGSLNIFKAQNPGYKRIRSRADKIINRVEQDEFFIEKKFIGGMPWRKIYKDMDISRDTGYKYYRESMIQLYDIMKSKGII